MLAFYSITNMYISPLQCGLQTAHCVSEMSCQTQHDSEYWSWAKSGSPVIIILNGGYASNLQTLYDRICDYNEIGLNVGEISRPFEVVKFHESPEAANELLTAVGVIIDMEEKDAIIAKLKLNDSLVLSEREQIIYDISKLRLA